MAEAELPEQEIRDLAYALWQEAGEPEGRGDEFWQKAQEVLKQKKGSADVDSDVEQTFPASDAVNHM